MTMLRSRWVKIAGGVVLAAVVVYFVFGTFMALKLTAPDRQTPPPSNAAQTALQTVPITARDGLRLAGWYGPAPGSQRAVLMVHGLGSCSLCDFDGKFVTLAGQVRDAGYSVLMIDLRGHGQSEGSHVTFGDGERWDVLGAIDWLRAHGATKVAVLGVSLGAVSTVRAALEPDGAQQINAMVLDSCFGDFGNVLNHSFTHETGYPLFLLPGGLLMTRVLLHVDLAGVKPLDELPRLKTPLLMMYGDQDEFVTAAQQQAMAAARPDATFWLLAGAQHARIYNLRPEEYVARVSRFLEQSLR
jgi:pimeloyl-ACP methyl ester carboxylesterase